MAALNIKSMNFGANFLTGGGQGEAETEQVRLVKPYIRRYSSLISAEFTGFLCGLKVFLDEIILQSRQVPWGVN